MYIASALLSQCGGAAGGLPSAAFRACTLGALLVSGHLASEPARACRGSFHLARLCTAVAMA